MHVSSPLSQRGRAREGALAGHNPALASTTHLSDTTRNATPRRWARPLPSLPPRREGTLVPETLHLRTSVIFVSCASNRLLRVAAREKSSPLSQRGRVREGALPPAINLTVSVTELLSIDGREPRYACSTADRKAISRWTRLPIAYNPSRLARGSAGSSAYSAIASWFSSMPSPGLSDGQMAPSW